MLSKAPFERKTDDAVSGGSLFSHEVMGSRGRLIKKLNSQNSLSCEGVIGNFANLWLYTHARCGIPMDSMRYSNDVAEEWGAVSVQYSHVRRPA